MATTPLFLSGESHGQRSLAGYTLHGVSRVGQNLATKPPPHVIVTSTNNILFHIYRGEIAQGRSVCKGLNFFKAMETIIYDYSDHKVSKIKKKLISNIYFHFPNNTKMIMKIILA